MILQWFFSKENFLQDKNHYEYFTSWTKYSIILRLKKSVRKNLMKIKIIAKSIIKRLSIEYKSL